MNDRLKELPDLQWRWQAPAGQSMQIDEIQIEIQGDKLSLTVWRENYCILKMPMQLPRTTDERG